MTTCLLGISCRIEEALVFPRYVGKGNSSDFSTVSMDRVILAVTWASWGECVVETELPPLP